MTSERRPVELGYRWPAEWESHTATWVAWPHNQATWPKRYDKIPTLFAAFVRTLAEFEPVHLLAGGPESCAAATAMFRGEAAVKIFEIETNDAWTRDYGPTFLLGDDVAIIDWGYNAWGGKYPPWEQDDQVPQQIAEELLLPRFVGGLTLEGGAIDGNGQGTLLTTTSCLLNTNRNPSVSREMVEQIFASDLGATEVIWLAGGGIAGDDTDGHVDQLARFVNAQTVVCAVSQDRHDEQYEPLQQNAERLRALVGEASVVETVVDLPVPSPRYFEEQRIPASYCNFYVANGLVIVPQFDDPADDTACQRLQELFPGRAIRGLPSTDLSWGLGSFHCLTQQQPQLLVHRT